MTGRPINQDRQNAIDLGLKTYIGAVHARCGTDVRYVSGGGCVHCAKVIASEQRDARKIVRAMEQQKLDAQIEEQIENHEEFAPDPKWSGDAIRYFWHPESGSLFTTEDGSHPGTDGLVEEIDAEQYAEFAQKIALDSGPEDGLDTDDAEARRQASFDELM